MLHVSKRCICLHLPKNLSLIFQFPTYIYMYAYNPLMTFVSIWKGFVLGSWPSKIEVIWVPGMYIYIYIEVALRFGLLFWGQDVHSRRHQNFDRFTIFLIVAIYFWVNTVLLGIITYSLTLELSWLAVILSAMLAKFSHLFVAVSRSSELTSSWWIKASLIVPQLTKHGKGWNDSTCVITHLLPHLLMQRKWCLVNCR